MIRWLLERLAHNPAAVFWRGELETRFPAEVPAAVAAGLLRPVPTDLNGTYTDTRSGRTYSLIQRDGLVEGWDEDDPEAMPIVLTPAQLGRFSVHSPSLVERFREVNGLEGQPDRLHPRLYLLGTLAGADSVPVVLVLCPSSEQAIDLLRGMASLFVSPPGPIIAVTPELSFTMAERKTLGNLGIEPVASSRTQPLVLPLSRLSTVEPLAAASDSEASQEESDFRFEKVGAGWEVMYRGHRFSLSHYNGLPYIQYLLRYPGQEFDILDLVVHVEAPPSELPKAGRVEVEEAGLSVGSSAIPMLSGEDREHLRAQLRDLEAKSKRRKLTPEEEGARDWLERQLNAAQGIGGSPRMDATARERERLRVTNLCRRAIAEIAKHDEAFAQFLRNSINTGLDCSYTPDQPVRLRRASA